MTDWKRVSGSQTVRPSEYDTTTSKFIVYQRRNITKVDELWEYEERELTQEEYMRMSLEQQRADIAYIAMETGVDL